MLRSDNKVVLKVNGGEKEDLYTSSPRREVVDMRDCE